MGISRMKKRRVIMWSMVRDRGRGKNEARIEMSCWVIWRIREIAKVWRELEIELSRWGGESGVFRVLLDILIIVFARDWN